MEESLVSPVATSKIVWNTQWVVGILTVIAGMTGLGVLWFACWAMFDCAVIVPGPGHVTVYPSVERMMTLGATAFGGVVALVTFEVYSTSAAKVSPHIRRLVLLSGFLSSALIPLLPVLNDVTAPTFLNLEVVNTYCAYTVAALYSIWSLLSIASVHASGPGRHFLSKYALRTDLCGLAFIGVLMAIQWGNSYKGEDRWILNEAGLGGSLWLALELLLLLPWLLTLQLPQFQIAYTPPEEDQIAYTPPDEDQIACNTELQRFS